MQNVDQIIQPRWLIPVDSSDSILNDPAIIVCDGKILDICSREAANKNYQTENTVSLEHHVMIPGLVNAHTHAAMTLMRGYADDLPLMAWLTEHIWPAEQKWVNPEFVRDGTNLAIAEMIRSGTTCFNDMYFYPDVVAKCAEEAGIRASIGMIVIDFPTVWARDADEYINKGLAVRDSVRHSGLVTAGFAPHAPYTVSDGPLQKIATLSEELDCRVTIHLHETAQEIEESVARYGVRPMERLDQFGLLSPNLLAIHMTQLLSGEIDTLAERGVNVVHCAESNLKLASGFCPVSRLDSAGVNLCIATDGASSNNDLDMIGEMRTASLLAKGVGEDPTALGAHKTIRAATLNPAIALGLDASIGSIEPGKSADLTAIDLSCVETAPVFNPASQIVYSATRDQVSDVWIGGKQLMAGRELLSMDIRKITGDANAWRDKILS